MDLDRLKAEYQAQAGRAVRFKEALVDQLRRLFAINHVSLGVPLESRMKSWGSLEDKLRRKSLEIESLGELDDLVGVRVILLFRADMVAAGKLLAKTFDIVSSEDASDRLSDAQFGYQSQHFTIRLPEHWLQIPTFCDLGGLKAEIQLRTLAQHIWAAASHKLQYKQEHSVPPPLRRAIHRVSALLETVDQEFDRILSDRQTYVAQQAPKALPAEPLNVDLVASILAEHFPAEFRSHREPVAELLEELRMANIDTHDKLESLILRHRTAVLPGTSAETIDRVHRPNHVALARAVLRIEFGEEKDGSGQ